MQRSKSRSTQNHTIIAEEEKNYFLAGEYALRVT